MAPTTQHVFVAPLDTLDDALPFVHIVASDADTAMTTFLTTYAPSDPVLLNEVYHPTINLSFAEHCSIQTDADDDLFASGRLQLSAELYAERVQEFFGAHHDYADRYLTYYFNADSRDTPRRASHQPCSPLSGGTPDMARFEQPRSRKRNAGSVSTSRRHH